MSTQNSCIITGLQQTALWSLAAEPCTFEGV